MRFKLIACKSMTRELSYLVSRSPHIIDITWIRQGFHDHPDQLRKVVQAEIDAVESGNDPHTNALLWTDSNPRTGVPEDIDAILLGYGLCSNGLQGIHSTKYPIVIPRAHDCITMLLGSKELYQHYFKTLPGCFWYTASWIENCSMPCEAVNRMEHDFYAAQGLYDEETLEFMMDNLQGWTKNYHHAAYIKMPFYDDPKHQEFTKEAARYFGWEFDLLEGDTSLLERFVAGKWSPEEFLYMPPGNRLMPTCNEDIIGYEPMEQG